MATRPPCDIVHTYIGMWRTEPYSSRVRRPHGELLATTKPKKGRRAFADVSYL